MLLISIEIFRMEDGFVCFFFFSSAKNCSQLQKTMSLMVMLHSDLGPRPPRLAVCPRGHGAQAPPSTRSVGSPNIYIFKWVFYHKSLSPFFSIIATESYSF